MGRWTQMRWISVFLLLCSVAFGTELVDEGMFDATGDWVVNEPWVITGGVATIDGSQDGSTDFTQTLTVVAGTWYRVKFTTVITTAYVACFFDGIEIESGEDSAGTYSYTNFVQAPDTSANLVFRADSTFVGTIDAVSVVAMANGGMSSYVGGSSSNLLHASWSYLDASTSVGANGESILEATSVDVDESDGGLCRITSGADVSDNMAGCYMNVHTNAGSEATGRYEIIHHDQGPSGADTFLIELDWIDADTTDMQYTIGGAVPIVDATYGLQEVLDHANSSAADQNAYIYVAGSDTATATIVADTGGGSSIGTIKRIIGTNTSYVADGTYATITADIDAPWAAGTPVIQIDDISYTTFENIHVIITGEDTPTAGEDGFQIANTDSGAGVFFINCKATDAYRGWNHAGATANRSGNTKAIDCVAVGSVHAGIYFSGANTEAIGCFIEGSGTYGIYSHAGNGVNYTDCIIDGGDTGIYFGNSGVSAIVSGCSFYNQTVACIGASGARDVGLTAYNNLFWVADINATFPILNTASVIFMIYEDYNFTNADATRASMLTGSNSDNTLWEDDEDNLWTDAANGDFTVVDAAMIDGGKPTLGDEGVTPVDGFSTPGAYDDDGGTFPRFIERHGD